MPRGFDIPREQLEAGREAEEDRLRKEDHDQLARCIRVETKDVKALARRAERLGRHAASGLLGDAAGKMLLAADLIAAKGSSKENAGDAAGSGDEGYYQRRIAELEATLRHAWDALNELRQDAQEAEDKVFKVLDGSDSGAGIA